jgi:L-threonylcarbamoyladenylate synthase
MNIINSNQIDQETITDKIANAIKNGGVVVMPFDTVYGFACDPTNEQALLKIFELKGRNTAKTIGVATCCIERLGRAARLSEQNAQFIKKIIPGKLTFILPVEKKIFSDYCYKDNSVAIRIPDSDLILTTAKKSGGFIAQTSANKSGQGACLKLPDFLSQFSKEEKDSIDLIVDGGQIKSEGVSTFWNLLGANPEKIER